MKSIKKGNSSNNKYESCRFYMKNSRTKVDTVLKSVNKRLQTFINSWPESMAADFSDHYNRFKRPPKSENSAEAKYFEYPFWILLPCWLSDKYSFNLKPYSRHFLKDMLWVQFCLFFFIRNQDDLFDAHTHKTSLIFASNLFLLEAENILARYLMSSSNFWPFFRDSVKVSSQAIVETATMQQTFTTSPGKLLTGYARTALCFNIGIAAICTKCKRMKDFPFLTRFAAEMVIAGQLMDDLEDIEEDFHSGKYNYAANRLLRQFGRRTIKKHDAPELIRRAILVTDGIGYLFRDVRRHLSLAEQAIEQVVIPEASYLIQKYQAGMTKMHNNFHHNRVNFFFDGLKSRC